MKEIKFKLITEFMIDIDNVWDMYEEGVDVNNVSAIETWLIDYYEFWNYEYDDTEIDYKEIQKFAIECYKEFEKEENK